jgi:predicted metal-dependent HD superfamily phosphohydrolase
MSCVCLMEVGRTAAVEKIWKVLCEKELSLPSSLADSWWHRISSEYSQPYRHYHTLQHLSEFLFHYSTHSSLISSSTPFVLAIFFHDIIYQPKSNANEDESIQLFQIFIQQCHDAFPSSGNTSFRHESWHQRLDEISISVIAFIELTKSHKFDEEGEVSLDAQLFCDMDMAILGSSPERYSEYSQQVSPLPFFDDPLPHPGSLTDQRGVSARAS